MGVAQIVKDIDIQSWIYNVLVLSPHHQHLLSLPFTRGNLICSIMDDNKAPGLYDYSVGFYKHAWDIIAIDITNAVLEVFHTSKMFR